MDAVPIGRVMKPADLEILRLFERRWATPVFLKDVPACSLLDRLGEDPAGIIYFIRNELSGGPVQFSQFRYAAYSHYGKTRMHYDVRTPQAVFEVVLRPDGAERPGEPAEMAVWRIFDAGTVRDLSNRPYAEFRLPPVQIKNPHNLTFLIVNPHHRRRR